MSNRHYSVKEQDVEKFNSKLLSISNARDEGDWKSIPHTHPFTELFFVSDGKGSFLFDQTTHSIYPGDLVIIPPYTEHTERSLPNQPLEYYVLGIDGISFLASDKTTGQIMMIPVFSIFSARCSRRSATPSTVPRPSARDCWKF